MLFLVLSALCLSTSCAGRLINRQGVVDGDIAELIAAQALLNGNGNGQNSALNSYAMLNLEPDFQDMMEMKLLQDMINQQNGQQQPGQQTPQTSASASTPGLRGQAQMPVYTKEQYVMQSAINFINAWNQKQPVDRQLPTDWVTQYLQAEHMDKGYYPMNAQGQPLGFELELDEFPFFEGKHAPIPTATGQGMPGIMPGMPFDMEYEHEDFFPYHQQPPAPAPPVMLRQANPASTPVTGAVPLTYMSEDMMEAKMMQQQLDAWKKANPTAVNNPLWMDEEMLEMMMKQHQLDKWKAANPTASGYTYYHEYETPEFVEDAMKHQQYLDFIAQQSSTTGTASGTPATPAASTPSTNFSPYMQEEFFEDMMKAQQAQQWISQMNAQTGSNIPTHLAYGFDGVSDMVEDWAKAKQASATLGGTPQDWLPYVMEEAYPTRSAHRQTNYMTPTYGFPAQFAMDGDFGEEMYGFSMYGEDRYELEQAYAAEMRGIVTKKQFDEEYQAFKMWKQSQTGAEAQPWTGHSNSGTIAFGRMPNPWMYEDAEELEPLYSMYKQGHYTEEMNSEDFMKYKWWREIHNGQTSGSTPQ